MADKTITVGPGKTYASLQQALSDEKVYNPDLVAMGGILNIVLYAFADTSSVSVSGFTTDATHYINIYTDTTARHAGVWNSNKYTLTRTSLGTVITVTTPYTRITGLQISSSPNSNSSLDSSGIKADASPMTAVSNIIRCTSPTRTQMTHGIETTDTAAGGTHHIYNNIIYGFSTSNAFSGGITCQDKNPSYIYNNTICDCKVGIRLSATDSPYGYAINNLIYNCPTPFNNGSAATSVCGYNATDGASWGTNYDGFTGDRLSQIFSFVNTGVFNYLLTTIDTGALTYGADLSADAYCPFDVDILGTTRTVPWSIGADQTTFDPLSNPAFMLLMVMH
jgi:hypothetical protein